ncbi:MAG: M14 family zinc carboxypeptidase [Bacteroidales bacterium]
MKIKHSIALVVCLIFSSLAFSQKIREKEWVVHIPVPDQIVGIQGVYPEKPSGEGIIAYVNADGMAGLKKQQVDFYLLPHPNEQRAALTMDRSADQLKAPLTSYPTYDAYQTMMHNYAMAFPSICRLDTFKVLPSGRQLLMMVIHNEPDSVGRNPVFLYTSSMHGDETGGFILMMNLIDTLLNAYGQKPRITDLVDNIKICINPLANPDGMYAGGNQTISGATRTNSNGVDLNRNFPDPEAGPHPDGYAWQPETNAFMDLADSMGFHMSSNIHSGAEVVNYPWDTWANTHANENWWLHVGQEYADTARKYSPANYFNDPAFPGGVTNGYDWYSISGGRQDYMNFFQGGREMTLELSYQKITPETALKQLWNYNKRSLLNYAEQAVYGVSGRITDSASGKPLKAKVFVDGMDADSTHIYSRAQDGYYHRWFDAGSYTLSFSKPGYKTGKIPLTMANYQHQPLNVELVPLSSISCSVHQQNIKVYPNPVQRNLCVQLPAEINNKNLRIRVMDMKGKVYRDKKISAVETEYQLSVEGIASGVYVLAVSNDSYIFRKKIVVK